MKEHSHKWLEGRYSDVEKEEIAWLLQVVAARRLQAGSSKKEIWRIERSLKWLEGRYSDIEKEETS
jgi:hypothetical protein